MGWQFDYTGDLVWVDDPPPPTPPAENWNSPTYQGVGPAAPTENWNSPTYQGTPPPSQGEGDAFRRWQYEQAGVGAGGNQNPWGENWSDPYGAMSQGEGWNFMRNQYNAAGKGASGTGPGPGGGSPGAGGPAGPGGGGGGGGPAPVDPYAWMADFGGPAIFKAYLRSAGERLQDYYSRHGGDPLKTLVNKYQEIKGMAPSTELRSMMVGALGWGTEIDPNTLQPVGSSIPDSPLLQSIGKSGGNYAGYDKNRGVRFVGTRPWTDITRDFKQFAAPGAAIWPPT